MVESNAAYRKGLGHVIQELGAIGNVCRMAAAPLIASASVSAVTSEERVDIPHVPGTSDIDFTGLHQMRNGMLAFA